MTDKESSLSRYTFVSGCSLLILGEKGRETPDGLSSLHSETISRYYPEEMEIKSLRQEVIEDNGDEGMGILPPRLQPPQPVSANLSPADETGFIEQGKSERAREIRRDMIERAKRDMARLGRDEGIIKDNKYPSCFSSKYANISNLCRGRWSVGYLYSECYTCSLLYIQLCENCSHSKFHGPHLRCKLGLKAGIGKTFRGVFIPQSKAIRFDYKNPCVTYGRRAFENGEYYSFPSAEPKDV
jgi:hypothetical protein